MSKDLKDQKSKEDADQTFAELVRMHCRLGHFQQVEVLLKSVEGREFTGASEPKVVAANEALWMMIHRAGTIIPLRSVRPRESFFPQERWAKGGRFARARVEVDTAGDLVCPAP